MQFRFFTALFILISFVSTGVIITTPPLANADLDCAMWKAILESNGKSLGTDFSSKELKSRINYDPSIHKLDCLDDTLATDPQTGAVLGPISITKTAAKKCSFDFLVDLGTGFVVDNIKKYSSAASNWVGLGGGSVPTSDSSQQAISEMHRFDDCFITLLEYGVSVMTARLAKRMADSLMDDVIDLIQNGGDDNFNKDKLFNLDDIFKDARHAAFGDAMMAIGATNLCSGVSLPRLQLQLQQATFSERASCTLDQVIGNTNAFYNDFTSGGWFGYTESLKPQNNRWGLEEMLREYYEERIEEEAEIASLQNSGYADGGFPAITKCKSWTPVDDQGNRVGATITFDNPQPEIPYGDINKGAVRWECISENVITPPGVVARIFGAATNAETGVYTNPTVAPYLSALTGAAVNRLKKEGIKYAKESFEEGSGNKDSIEQHTRARDEVIKEKGDPNYEPSRDEVLDKKQENNLRDVNLQSVLANAPSTRSSDQDSIVKINERISKALDNPGKPSLKSILENLNKLLSDDSPLVKSEKELIKLSSCQNARENKGEEGGEDIPGICPHTKIDIALLSDYRQRIVSATNSITDLKNILEEAQKQLENISKGGGGEPQLGLSQISSSVRNDVELKIPSMSSAVASIEQQLDIVLEKIEDVDGGFQKDLEQCSEPKEVEYRCHTFEPHL
jgi:hypothetical protein